MLENRKIGFVGAGQMSEAIFSGALAKGALAADQIWVSDLLPQRLEYLQNKYHIHTRENGQQEAGTLEMLAQCDLVVLAVKPQFCHALLQAIGAHFMPEHTVVSIMGGIPLATLEMHIPNAPVLRVMPNTPMFVGKGCASISPGKKAADKDLLLCKSLFDAVGSSLLLAENLVNAFTAVGGCGPAFAYLFMEALADGGVQQGLPRDVAQKAAAQMLAGAAEMVLQTGIHPGQLKDNVCSPGGGTIAGVAALEAGAFRGTVMQAVEESRKKMDALGS